MSDVAIDGDLFFSRLERLRNDWLANKALDVWGDSADVVCIPMGSSTDQDAVYSKSSSIHLFLLGYEFPESLLVLTKNELYFMATAKKIAFLEAIRADDKFPLKFIQKTKDDAMNRENCKALLDEIRPASKSLKMGTIMKAQFEGKFINSWMEVLKEEGVTTTEISKGLGLFLSIKDSTELDTCKRAAVLTNKVMKHGFVKDMEEIIDQEKTVTHEALAALVEEKIFDPHKIGVKVSKDVVECCYNPIIQSGGRYDIRPSAVSDTNNMKYDIIICSLGARYRNYCGNISRTYMVDVPQRVVKVYAILISLFDTCLEQMTIGKPLNSVLLEARAFLERKDASLVACLPKSLGFAIGLEFRDGTMVLNASNDNLFEEGMVFNLSVGLSNVPMDDGTGAKIPDAMRHLENFSLLISDTVAVQKEGVPDVLTKLSKAFSDVHYNIGGDEDEEEAEEEESQEKKDRAIAESMEDSANGQRRSARFKEEKAASENAALVRATRQHELMEKKIAEKQRKASKKGAETEEEEEKEAVDLKTYPSTEHFPQDCDPRKLRVDMTNEAVLLPISGQLVPFHISTIKHVSMPEPDKATYLRINFFSTGQSLGKDCPKNVSRLISKYGDYSSFVKELTFRSLDSRNLTSAYRSILELRRRVRQREQKEEEEKDLVQQAKLIRIRDERVPRLQDLTMRPHLSGRKSSGTLEAHQNGLRFVSSRQETMDVMYSNIKHAIYQPCQNSTMVIIHFHLKEFVIIGKKKCKDIQFYTEVVESFINLDNQRRSAYDPDELDDEQRERQMKKTLNKAFADFCKKVEKVAKHFKFPIEFDSPYMEFSFYGTCHKEMVLIQPSVYCLVNLTEMPNFCLSISDVEHVHFERVNFATKAFDMVLIFKNFDLPPQHITAIEMKNLEMIQDWLNEVQVTYTAGSMSVNWNAFMSAAKNDPRFYFDTDEDGERKPIAWFELTEDADVGGSDSETEEGESSYDESEDESDSDDDDSDDSEESFEDEESEGSYDEEAEDELEEEGMDWDEMHRHAASSDRKREARDEDVDDERDRRSSKKSRR